LPCHILIQAKRFPSELIFLGYVDNLLKNGLISSWYGVVASRPGGVAGWKGGVAGWRGGVASRPGGVAPRRGLQRDHE
jgi:hypothetical protein